MFVYCCCGQVATLINGTDEYFKHNNYISCVNNCSKSGRFSYTSKIDKNHYLEFISYDQYKFLEKEGISINQCHHYNF